VVQFVTHYGAVVLLTRLQKYPEGQITTQFEVLGSAIHPLGHLLTQVHIYIPDEVFDA